MKFYKLKDSSAVEAHEDNVKVPYADEISQLDYASFITNLTPAQEPATTLQTDIANLNFTSLADANTKLKAILERIRKGER